MIKDIFYRVNCLDFSNDGKFLQINMANSDMKFIDIHGQKVLDSGAALKEEKWFTFTCVYGWSVFGVWPPCSDGQDINATDRHKDGNTIVAVDDFGKVSNLFFLDFQVKLFKYPCPVSGSGCAKYSGHSSYVCNVKFTFDGNYVISVGGDEKSIF